MMKLGMAVAAAVLLGATGAQAQDGRFAIGPQIGTTGVGVEAQFKVSDRVTLRGGFDSLQFDEEVDGDDILYDGELDFSTGGVFADLHPSGGAFFLSAGVYFGDRQVSVSGTPAPGTTVEIGDDTFTAAQVGTLNGEMDFGSTAPFVGLGWNNTFTASRRWGFKFLVGAAFGSDPDASLTRVGGSTLSPADQARFDAELRAEEIEIEEEADGFKVFPVVQLGVAYRF